MGDASGRKASILAAFQMWDKRSQTSVVVSGVSLGIRENYLLQRINSRAITIICMGHGGSLGPAKTTCL